MKTCKDCKETKSLSEFRKTKGGKYGVSAICKLDYKKRYGHFDEERKSFRKDYKSFSLLEQISHANKIVSYNSKARKEQAEEITEVLLLQMWLEQDGKCAICYKDLPKISQAYIDHDHKTGKIRGLLCSPCNLALGGFKDDPIILTNAFSYIQRLR